MPIPFLVAGLVLTTTVRDTDRDTNKRLSKREKNELAREISENAQYMCQRAKVNLERAQNNTKESLIRLEYQKKDVLESSMKQFLGAYDKIKHVEIRKSEGLNELENFLIDQKAAIQLHEITDIYSNSISNSIGYSSLAILYGKTMTPLDAIVEPFKRLVASISEWIKADENLEKANALYAKAEAVSEKLKVSETLCNAISDRAELLNELLMELNVMFTECSGLLAGVVRKKERRIFKKEITSKDFSEKELKLIAVTRALAGAVKAVIDTPILSKEGNITFESENVYEQTVEKLPDFGKVVDEVKSVKYRVKPVRTYDNYEKYPKFRLNDFRKSKSFKIGVGVLIVLMLVSILGKMGITISTVVESITTFGKNISKSISDNIDKESILDKIDEIKEAATGSIASIGDEKMKDIEMTDDEFSENNVQENYDDGHISENRNEKTKRDNDEYILPESGERYYTYDELINYDASTLRIARNEIYARHGRIFSTEDLQTYFEAQSWYEGVYSAEAFNEEWLNEYELENLELIKSIENNQGVQTSYQDSYVNLYEMVVLEYGNAYGEWSEYTLWDINEDGIQELIVSYGTCNADWTNSVYTLLDNEIIWLGDFYGPVGIYDGDWCIYSVYEHMDYIQVECISIYENQLFGEYMEGTVYVGEQLYFSYTNDLEALY